MGRRRHSDREQASVELLGRAYETRLPEPDRKSRGVYYTPGETVDYIVRHALGKLLAGKTTAQALSVRIIDPACGCGAFLIAAYRYLLEWHSRAAGRALTLAERQRILRTSIHGIDIDADAVEIARHSLRLICHDGQRQSHALDLHGNIECGDGLVRSVGSFDAVIGNPPWGSKLVLRAPEVAALAARFDRSAHNLNVFAPFIDLSLKQLLSPGGRLGLLIPKNFLKTRSYAKYRADLLDAVDELTVVDFGAFPGVAQEAVAILASKSTLPARSELELIGRVDHTTHRPRMLDGLSAQAVRDDPFHVISLARGGHLAALVQQMQQNCIRLGDCYEIGRGMEHGRRGRLLRCASCGRHFEKPGKQHSARQVTDCRHCGAAIAMDDPRANVTFIFKGVTEPRFRGLLTGTSIDRYMLREIPFLACTGLPGVDYKGLHHLGPKLLFIRIARTLRGYLDEANLLCLNALNVVRARADSPYDLRFVLGVLNSRAMADYAEYAITAGATLTIRFSNEIMRALPLPKLDLSFPADRARHDVVVSRVQRMLQNSTSRVDREIDWLVAELYGLRRPAKQARAAVASTV